MRRASLISAVIILLGGGLGNYLRFVTQPPEHPPSFDAIPLDHNGYYGEERRLPDYNYEVLQADTTTLRLYRGPEGDLFWLFVAYFESQEYGSQMHSPKLCLPGGGWRIESHEPFNLLLPSGDTKTINRLIIVQQDSRQLMYYWYQTRGGALTNEFAVKWDLAVNSLLFRPTDAAFVRLTLPLANDDLEAAGTKAIRFLNSFYPYLMEALPFDN